MGIPKARVLHRVWGGGLGAFVSELWVKEENLHLQMALYKRSLFSGMGFIWSLRETINRKSRNDIFIELLCRAGLHLKSKFSLFEWEQPHF